jgi:hypothetical protein
VAEWASEAEDDAKASNLIGGRLAASIANMHRPDCSTLAASVPLEKPKGTDPRPRHGMNAVDSGARSRGGRLLRQRYGHSTLPPLLSLSLSAGGPSNPTTWPDRFHAV